MHVVLSLYFVSVMFDYPYIMLHAAGLAWTGVTDTDLVPAFDWYCALDAMFSSVVVHHCLSVVLDHCVVWHHNVKEYSFARVYRHCQEC